MKRGQASEETRGYPLRILWKDSGTICELVLVLGF